MKTRTASAALLVPLALTISPSSWAGVLSETWSSTPQTLIPDNSPLGLSDTLAISTPIASITDLQVTLDILGGYNGDFYAYLRSNNGGFAVLLNRVGSTAANPYGSADSGFNVTFSDTAAQGDIHLASSGGGMVAGTWQPDGRNVSPFNALDTSPRTAFLSSFTGLNPNTAWTLFVADVSPSGVGTLENWSVTITGDVTDVPEPPSTAVALLALVLSGLWPLWYSRCRGRT